MSDHLDDLFSGAYERELHGEERVRFDAHIADCSSCATGYAEFCAAVSAMRALPRASMPVAVVLPSSPPVAAGGLTERLLRIPRAFRATTAMAAAAAAAFGVITLTSHPAGTAITSAPSISSSNGDVGAAGAPPALAIPAPADRGTTCQPRGVDAGVASQAPAAFSNRATNTSGAAQIIVATTGSRVTAGSTVLVYARVSTPVAVSVAPGSHATPPPAAQVVPCVTLTADQPSVGYDSAAGVAPQAMSSSALRTLAEAVPTLDAESGGLRLQAIRIPAGLPVGTVLNVRATLPPAASGSAPLSVSLTLVVG